MIYFVMFLLILSCGDPFDTNVSGNKEEDFYSVSRAATEKIYIDRVKILSDNILTNGLETNTSFSINKYILRDICIYIQNIIDIPEYFSLNKNILKINFTKDNVGKTDNIKVIFNQSNATFNSINDQALKSSEYFSMKYTNNNDILKEINSYILKKRYVIHNIDGSLRLDCFVDIISKEQNGRASLRIYSISIGKLSKYKKSSSNFINLSTSKIDYKNNELHNCIYEKKSIKNTLNNNIDKIFELNSEGHSSLSLAISMNKEYPKNNSDRIEEILKINFVKEILYKVDNSKKYVWRKGKIGDRIISLESYPILSIFSFEYSKDLEHSKKFNKQFVLMDKYTSSKVSKSLDEYIKYLKSNIIDEKDKKISNKMLESIAKHIKENRKFENFALDILKYLEFVLENINNEKIKKDIPYFSGDRPIANLCIDIKKIITKLCKKITNKEISEINSSKISEAIDKILLIDKCYNNLLKNKN